MITKEMVSKCYKKGVITLDIDPDMDHGTVARIGESYFYFGGELGDDLNPDEYRQQMSEADIISEMCAALEEERTEFPDQYDYFEAVLRLNSEVALHENTGKWAEVKCD